jgi:YD repeat-containing protein
MNKQKMKTAVGVLLVSLLYCVPGYAQKKSDREKDGLIGPVRTVRIDRAQFFIEAGKMVEGPRMLAETLVYDAAGRRIESADYLPGGAPDTKSTWKFDDAGREIERSYYVHDSLVRRWVSTYDDKGRIRERTEYGPGGGSVGRLIYEYSATGNQARVTDYGSSDVRKKWDETYDAQRNLLERIEYDADGSSQSKYIYTYDAAGNRTSETHYYKSNGSPHISKSVYIFDENSRLKEEAVYQNGALSSRKVYQYDNRCNRIEAIEYSKKGEVEERATLAYEYAPDGNWTKAKVTLTATDPRRPARPGYVAYRTLTFLGDKAVELRLAAKNGDLNGVKTVIEQGTDVNAKDADGRTATLLAAREGHTVIVQLLLSKGAQVEAKDNEGWTVLMWASEFGHTDVVKLLLASGANVNARSNVEGTALMPAALHGHVEIVRLLLSKGADPNAKARDGSTALMVVAAEGQAEMVRFLLENGAEVNARTKEGTTALMFAAEGGDVESAKALLNKGADVKAANQGGKTALSIATAMGYTEMVKLLKNAKAIK